MYKYRLSRVNYAESLFSSLPVVQLFVLPYSMAPQGYTVLIRRGQPIPLDWTGLASFKFRGLIYAGDKRPHIPPTSSATYIHVMEEEETDVHQLGERLHFQFNFHFLVDCSQTASIYWMERNRQKSIILILEWFKSFPAHSPASLPCRFHWLDTITYCITTYPWPILASR